MRPRTGLSLLLVALGAVGCGARTQAPHAPRVPPISRLAASGVLILPAAHAFGEPGFHQVLTASARLPERIARGSRWRVEVALADAGRPTQRCSFDHPLSGCATVDWSDDPSRPNVPATGVFRNTLTVRLASGVRTLYLRQSGALASSPDPFRPG